MKLAVLFTGGKDSMLALKRAKETDTISCLITIKSTNPDSYMFHTPNINLTELQAKKLNIPIITQITQGKKEEELEDLKTAIQTAKDKYQIEGIVTGAVESVYQGTRIQKICNKLNIFCFNPLWKADQETILKEMLDFKIMITGIASFPFDKNWLGKIITKQTIEELKKLKKYQISLTGEGGEYESTVLNTDLFSSEIIIKKSRIEYKDHAGKLFIEEAE